MRSSDTPRPIRTSTPAATARATFPVPIQAATVRRTRRVAPLPSGGCPGAGWACTTRATGPGERLWYALDRRFRANGYKYRPLNRDTAADLVVDGRGGIAAVILAPGPALPFQDRSRDRFDPAQYLEGGNESPGDGAYVSREGSPSLPNDRFNDRVDTIPRDELMAAAARRALAAAREALEEYRAAPWNTGVLPWLAPWTAPAEGGLSVPGVTAGRLPLLRNGSTFETSFRVTGPVAGGAASASGTVPPAALGLAGQVLDVAAGECSWTGAWRIECTGESRTVAGARPGAGVPVRPALQRR